MGFRGFVFAGLRFVPALILIWTASVALASPDSYPAVKMRLASHSPKLVTKRVDKPTLYVVGYSHLDTQWCWTLPQVIREFIPNTLHDNFTLFDKYPDYIFNWTGSNRYAFMKEYYPADYAKLKQYVAQGRWFPAGSSIEEGDVNAPSGESLIRQVLYGNEFFRKEFGIASDEFMLPDCFGFPASLPTILAHCGLKGFSTQKLTWGSAVGIPFNVGVWKGPDGSSMVSALNPGSYGNTVDDDLSHDKGWIKRVQDDATRSGVPVDYAYYGTGDRGGSPDENSVKNVEKSLHAGGPLNIFAGRADQMFRDLSPDQIAGLPVYQGDLELTQHSAGSLTSEAEMKRWNRENELLGDATERASVAAHWLGALPYDRSRITDAWLRFLPGQFHDLMAGTALPAAYNYTWNDEVIALNEFSDVLTSAVGGVARGLDTQVKGVPVVVYNPLSIARQDVVEATVPSTDSPVVVSAPDGKHVPVQVLSRSGNRAKILFLATVPSVGFAVYDVHKQTMPDEGRLRPADLHVTSDSLENERYRVRLDQEGDVASVYDKSLGKELLSSPIRLAFQHENPNDYPAWNMDWKDQRKPPRGYVTGPTEVKVVESGPVRVALQVTRHSEGSTFVQTIRLAQGGNRVEFVTRIDWRGKECALKATFPLTASNPVATYNWGPGTVQRDNNNPKRYEVASHQWFDLTDRSGDFGVTVLDDTKQGSDKPDDSTLRLTLLYTPGIAGGYQHQGTQDLGRHDMIYALEGHRGDWREGKSQWEADRMNQPLLAFGTAAHAGGLGKSFSLVSISSPDVSIGALKMAENGNRLILRLNELNGQSVSGADVTFAGPVAEAQEVDGQERPIGQATVRNGRLVADMSPYHPRAFEIQLASTDQRLDAPQSTPLSLPYDLDATTLAAHTQDGDFDGHGRSIPGDLLPSTLVSDGVTFQLGPVSGQKNALVCRGQDLQIPSGKSRKLYLLASSADGDTMAEFKIGNQTLRRRIEAWDGFIGQWDNRLWGGVVPTLAYDWHNPMVGLEPGFIKRDPVAWYADHRRLRNGSDDIYGFCYLFRYSIDIPDGSDNVTLPNNPRIRVMAATVASNPNDLTVPIQPLYDVLDRQGTPGPQIFPSSGSFKDSTQVELGHAFYYAPSDTLRYTVDGSEPSLGSPVYGGPIPVRQTETIKVIDVDVHGNASPVTSARIEVNDVTPPSIVSTEAMAGSPFVRVDLSEQVVKADAERTNSYTFSPAVAVRAAQLESDGKSVDLELAAPLPNVPHRISVNGVRDLSPNANRSRSTVDLTLAEPVISVKAPKNGYLQPERRLPTAAGSRWTINMFVYLDHQAPDLSVAGGFGDDQDSNGGERFLISRHGHVYFWGSNIDIDSGVSYDLHRWQMVTATYDGRTVRVFQDGKQIAQEDESFTDATPDAWVTPPSPWTYGHRFDGHVAGFSIWNQALPEVFLKELLKQAPTIKP